MGAGSQYVCGPGRIKPSHKSAQSVTIMNHEAHLEVQRSSIRDGLRPPSGKTEATSSIMDIDYRHDQETVIAWAVFTLRRDCQCQASQACQGHEP